MNYTDITLIPKRIKHIREVKRLSQNDIAEKLGYEQSKISRIESGKDNLAYDVFFLYEFAKCTETDFNYLITGEPPASEYRAFFEVLLNSGDKTEAEMALNPVYEEEYSADFDSIMSLNNKIKNRSHNQYLLSYQFGDFCNLGIMETIKATIKDKNTNDIIGVFRGCFINKEYMQKEENFWDIYYALDSIGEQYSQLLLIFKKNELINKDKKTLIVIQYLINDYYKSENIYNYIRKDIGKFFKQDLIECVVLDSFEKEEKNLTQLMFTAEKYGFTTLTEKATKGTFGISYVPFCK